MNITEWAIRNKTTVLIFSVLAIIAGLLAYDSMGKLKNPNFIIQTAVVITEYPGATPEEVELQVTEVIEKYVQKLGSLNDVYSISEAGLSTIYVDIQQTYSPDAMPQIWNELRERMTDAQFELPSGVRPPYVVDHFGNTYGVYLALYGDGFTYEELRTFAQYAQKRLKLCLDVEDVILFGVQDEHITVNLSRERMANLGINPNLIVQSLQDQNLITSSGDLIAGSGKIRLAPGGNFKSVEDISHLIVGGGNGAQGIHLGDVADIRREYIDPPTALMRYNGHPAIGIGLSTVDHGNAVLMGEDAKKRLNEMLMDMPVGLHADYVNFQADDVKQAINTFVVALLEAIAIVLLVLFFSLGWRSAVVITNGLVVNICAAFIFMRFMGIDLQNVSIGGLIIVLGMLVDDSVVVTDNVMVRLREGTLTTDEACIKAARATGWQQIVATFIAIASFLPIILAKSNIGAFCSSLFIVVAITLTISWVQAMTVVPVLAGKLMKNKKAKRKENSDPYDTHFYRIYRRFLRWSIRLRWVTVGLTVLLLVLACWGFGFVKQVFMPATSRAQYQINYWLPEGTRIEKTSSDLAVIEKELQTWAGVKSVTTSVGEGLPRIVLTYTPEQHHDCYGYILVNTENCKQVEKLIEKTRAYLAAKNPQADTLVIPFSSGGTPNYSVELRISGDDPTVLRKLGAQVNEIMRADPDSCNIRDDWRNRTPVWEASFMQDAGIRTDISRKDITYSLLRLTHGLPIGTYREEDRQLSILIRAPKEEREALTDILNEPVWGNGAESVPLGSLVTDTPIAMRDPIIRRYNRIRTLTAQCNSSSDNPVALRNRLAERIDKMDFPAGYTTVWGGLFETQNIGNNSIYAVYPLATILMLLAVVLLFNAVRQPLILFLTLPLSIIGVTVAMLLTQKGFGFMAILGVQSLIGMMIRNAVILLTEIDEQIAQGEDRFQSLCFASMTRVRPVLITAFCTTMGMIPLVNDVLFGSMAVTIMGGLLFATVLTLIFIPVLYAIFFRIKE